MSKRTLIILSAGILISTLAAQGFAQVQSVPNRIPQQIVINGQQANGVYVTAPTGGMQSYSCSNPQQYSTPDGSAQGWACYEQATGAWLLNAVPPAGVTSGQGAVLQGPVPMVPQHPTIIYQPPTVIYRQPATSYVYVTPSYPVFVAPAYSPGVVLGAAAIRAGGRIVSSALIRPYYVPHYLPRVTIVNRGHYRRH